LFVQLSQLGIIEMKINVGVNYVIIREVISGRTRFLNFNKTSKLDFNCFYYLRIESLKYSDDLSNIIICRIIQKESR